MDWRDEIVRAVLVRQRLQELDARGLWDYHLPGVAATPGEVARAEESLGYRLTAGYRDFLGYANGWKSFYQDVDILSTAELVAGELIDRVGVQLGAVEPEVLRECTGLSLDQIYPVAASLLQADMFLASRHADESAVIWFAGSHVERFSSFSEFFLSMVDYNRRQVGNFEEGDASSESSS